MVAHTRTAAEPAVPDELPSVAEAEALVAENARMQTEIFLLRAQLMHAREQIEPARFKPGRRSLSSYGGYGDNGGDYSGSLDDTSYAWAYGYDENDDSNDCTDLDNGATDPYGDGCAVYTQVPSWCGGYDDSDFLSMQMCCACGGGGDGNHNDDCSASCYGFSCDYWSESCVVLESGHGCDCTGCECNDDDGSSGNDAYGYGESDGTNDAVDDCSASCYGQSCDYWSESCVELESDYNCDCTGCECNDDDGSSGGVPSSSLHSQPVQSQL